MLYRICGAQGKNEDDFQLKLDGVYYPLNDDITQITLMSELLSQISGPVVVLRDQIHIELENLINLIRLVKLGCLMI